MLNITSTPTPVAASTPWDGLVLNREQEAALSGLGRLRGRYVGYPVLTEALSALNKLKLMAPYAEQLGTSASALLITGPSGSGKSRLLQEFAAKYPRITSGADGDVCPVVYVQLFGVCSRQTLVRLCLEALHVPVGQRETVGALTTLLMHHLDKQKVEMLILDEANHLISMRDQRLDYDAADFIKTILNAKRCSVVVAGLPAARAIFTANSQLHRRAYGAVAFKPIVRRQRLWHRFEVVN